MHDQQQARGSVDYYAVVSGGPVKIKYGELAVHARNRRQKTNVLIVSVLFAVVRVVNLALRSNAQGSIEVVGPLFRHQVRTQFGVSQ